MIVFGLGFHLLDVDDLSFLIEKSDRERNQRIAHPHAMPVREGENEQHALVRGKVTALHESLHAGRLGRGDFGLDTMESGAQFHDGHCLCMDGRRDQEQKAEEIRVRARHRLGSGVSGGVWMIGWGCYFLCRAPVA